MKKSIPGTCVNRLKPTSSCDVAHRTDVAEAIGQEVYLETKFQIGGPNIERSTIYTRRSLFADHTTGPTVDLSFYGIAADVFNLVSPTSPLRPLLVVHLTENRFPLDPPESLPMAESPPEVPSTKTASPVRKILFKSDYVKTIRGRMKIAEMVFAVVTFICAVCLPKMYSEVIWSACVSFFGFAFTLAYTALRSVQMPENFSRCQCSCFGFTRKYSLSAVSPVDVSLAINQSSSYALAVMITINSK
ncbi:unnamed protein product [Soboliphyme baturini]|uniref:MARVEL domain-containing protein n=1 Tax=Soboliphyme baturini TaxID=241478 RepID=A0A183J270_9BILA|nr:unnamed protein product [Soboliphyme baturini]